MSASAIDVIGAKGECLASTGAKGAKGVEGAVAAKAT